MPQNSLVKYIKEQINAGYNINTIKKYLPKYGYSQSQIDKAIKYSYPAKEVKHVIHPSKTTIALVVAIIFTLALISLATFIYLVPQKAPSQLLDLRISQIAPSINQGEPLHFTIEMSNLGKAKRYDVTLKYEIYNLKDALITFKEESMALETRASSSVNIELPSIKPGSYYLKTTALYNKKTAKATSSFKVLQKEIPTAPEPTTIPEPPKKTCPTSCDDNNECTNDYCNEAANYECKHDAIFPCCGNNICEDNENYQSCISDCPPPSEKIDSIFEGKTIWERLDIIKDIAKSDKEKALAYCKEIEPLKLKYDCLENVGISSKDKNICLEIEDEQSKDNCYKEIAKETVNSDICSSIAKDSKRDQCYMEFVTKGDYTVCDKLVNKYLKQGCESLKEISESQPA